MCRADTRYCAVLISAEDGFVCAQVAEVPEAISQGHTVEEAKANVAEALQLALAWRRDEGEELPAPAHVALSPIAIPRSQG
jgi:predicted RNase H-like HicB family nuclease